MPVVNPGASYGWRARIGLLQPTLGCDTNAFEFYLMAPEGVQMLLTSLGIETPGLPAYETAIAGIETPIRRLLGRRPDCIVQAGVPPIVTKGWGFEDELKARVAKIPELPFASDIGCCIAAMHAAGIKRVAVLANAGLQKPLAEYLGHAGIETVAMQEPPHTEEASSESLDVQYRAARALWQCASGADGIYIPIAARPSVGMIQALEDEIGAPVITSAQAMFWQGLRMAGVNTAEVCGFGRVFQAG